MPLYSFGHLIDKKISDHSSLESDIHGIVAFGVLFWSGSAFSWGINSGLEEVGSLGEPVHSNTGKWGVTTKSRQGSYATISPISQGVLGKQDAPISDGFVPMIFQTFIGATVSLNVVGSPIDVDPDVAIIMVYK